MMNRGGFSFVAMLVINPIVILFYQNCSMTPVSYAKNTPPASVSRSIASEAQPKVATPEKAKCAEGQQNCLKAE